jgi:hypothetical protein
VQERVVLKLREWMETGVPEYGLLSFGEIQELQDATRCGRHYVHTVVQRAFAFVLRRPDGLGSVVFHADAALLIAQIVAVCVQCLMYIVAARSRRSAMSY